MLFLVGDDADGEAADARVAADEGAAVVGPVFVELAAVGEAGDDFVHVVGVGRRVGIDERVEVLRGIFRRVFLLVEW